MPDPRRGRGRTRAGPRRLREAGMVTVELAAALPVLVLLILTGLSAVRIIDARVRCLDAAREGALAAARSDPQAASRAAALAPAGARVAIGRSGSTARVSVTAAVRPLGGLLPAVRVSETSVAALEPAAGAPP